MAEAAWDHNNAQLFEMVVKFFNTYLRSAINAHDIRTAYNVLNQYRLVGESAIKRDASGARALEIAKYFKYYGLLSFNAKLPFILETVAYDMCALIEFAFDQKSPATQPLLKIFCRSTRKARRRSRRPACAACARRSSSWRATSCCVATRRWRAKCSSIWETSVPSAWPPFATS
jgi:hypothetical protein